MYYHCKSFKYSDTLKRCFNHPKTEKKRFYHRVIMHPKDAGCIANSEDPDQTALGAV